MKNRKRIAIVMVLLILCLSGSLTAEAKSKDVTAKYRTGVTKMLNELDGYLCYDIAFFYDAQQSGKFVFNDYAKTSMVCYRRLWSVYNKSVASVKRKCLPDLKLFFGSSAKFRLRTYSSDRKNSRMPYIMQNQNGILRYLGGDYGECFPCGKVTKILEISSGKYVVTYKEYLRYIDSEEADYRGTYQIYLKKAKNRYGFIITIAIQNNTAFS